jgi:hypothetical protein
MRAQGNQGSEQVCRRQQRTRPDRAACGAVVVERTAQRLRRRRRGQHQDGSSQKGDLPAEGDRERR